MIIKALTTDDPNRLMLYLLQSPKFATATVSEGTEPELFADGLNKHHANFHQEDKLTIHVIVMLPLQTVPTKQGVEELTQEALLRVGLRGERPYITVAHHNLPRGTGQHIHIVTSRLGFDGTVAEVKGGWISDL